jgi:hypothetical protein
MKGRAKMAHSPVRDQLTAIAGSNAGDPVGFLEDLSDVHAEWHGTIMRNYGFLLFHHRVVRHFNTIVNTQIQPPVADYTPAEFQAMGVQPFGANLANIDTLQELANLSVAIESWHNNAHSRIATATQTPLMDPRQNIFFRPFWQLHFYIDTIFQRVLQQYGDGAHPGQFVAISAVASHIEAAHHGWVPRI